VEIDGKSEAILIEAHIRQEHGQLSLLGVKTQLVMLANILYVIKGHVEASQAVVCCCVG
jgi:hypothetical protein